MLPKLNCVFKWILKNLSNAADMGEAQSFLKRAHFVKIGSGCEANVFSRKGFDYVIKIVHRPHYQNSISLIQDTPPLSHFVESFLVDTIGGFRVILQKKIDIEPKKGRDGWAMLTRFEACLRKNSKCVPFLSDVIYDNMGFDKNKPVLLDWAAVR